MAARGFTLIEVLMTLAIMSMLAGLGLLVSMEAVRAARSGSGRDMVLNALSIARSRALAGRDESAHGVCLEGESLVLFRGDSFMAGHPENESWPLPEGIELASESGTFACEDGGLAFSMLQAITAEETLTVREEGRPDAVIRVNEEGAIEW